MKSKNLSKREAISEQDCELVTGGLARNTAAKMKVCADCGAPFVKSYNGKNLCDSCASKRGLR